MYRSRNCLLKTAVAVFSAVVCLPGYSAQLEESLDVVAATHESAVESQSTIDTLSRDTQILLEEYRALRDNADYQAAYTRELEQLDATQQLQIESLRSQIADARITRQRILPLMRSMADALEQFVVLDLPFRQEERIAAVLQLKQRLNRPSISAAARFRLLLEAYQIEQNYGASVESWRGPLLYEESKLSVDFLRVGRTALYFQSLDREQCGYWNRHSQAWEILPSGFNRELSHAMRVAKSQSAPELLQLPLPAPGSDA